MIPSTADGIGQKLFVLHEAPLDYLELPIQNACRDTSNIVPQLMDLVLSPAWILSLILYCQSATELLRPCVSNPVSGPIARTFFCLFPFLFALFKLSEPIVCAHLQHRGWSAIRPEMWDPVFDCSVLRLARASRNAMP